MKPYQKSKWIEEHCEEPTATIDGLDAATSKCAGEYYVEAFWADAVEMPDYETYKDVFLEYFDDVQEALTKKDWDAYKKVLLDWLPVYHYAYAEALVPARCPECGVKRPDDMLDQYGERITTCCKAFIDDDEEMYSDYADEAKKRLPGPVYGDTK